MSMWPVIIYRSLRTKKLRLGSFMTSHIYDLRYPISEKRFSTAYSLRELEKSKIRMLKVSPFRYANCLFVALHSFNLKNCQESKEIITKISPVFLFPRFTNLLAAEQLSAVPRPKQTMFFRLDDLYIGQHTNLLSERKISIKTRRVQVCRRA